MKSAFVCHRGASTERRELTLSHAVIAGWTGRDPDRVEEHISELKKIGVAPPSTTPLFYRVSASRLTTGEAIETCGDRSSGEVETVLVSIDGALWVGVGSDHTDRGIERSSVAMSKQLCDKPLAPELWAFDDVADHWDSLELRSWIVVDGERIVYQEGTTSALLGPGKLIDEYAGGTLPDETAMFCGTLPAKGGVRPAERFAFELHDPVLDRRIAHAYDVVVLPIVS